MSLTRDEKTLLAAACAKALLSGDRATAAYLTTLTSRPGELRTLLGGTGTKNIESAQTLPPQPIAGPPPIKPLGKRPVPPQVKKPPAPKPLIEPPKPPAKAKTPTPKETATPNVPVPAPVLTEQNDVKEAVDSPQDDQVVGQAERLIEEHNGDPGKALAAARLLRLDEGSESINRVIVLLENWKGSETGVGTAAERLLKKHGGDVGKAFRELDDQLENLDAGSERDEILELRGEVENLWGDRNPGALHHSRPEHALAIDLVRGALQNQIAAASRALDMYGKARSPRLRALLGDAIQALVGYAPTKQPPPLEPLPADTVPLPDTPDRHSLRESPVRSLQRVKTPGFGLTFDTTLEDGGRAAFKPALGEPPNTYPRRPLGKGYTREATAADVINLFGAGRLVPTTVIRDLEGDVGSLQKWVDGTTAIQAAVQFGDTVYGDDETFALVAALDFALGNGDRNKSNWMVGPDGRIHLIDHEKSFPETNEMEAGRAAFLNRASKFKTKIPAVVRNWLEKWPEAEALLRGRGFSDSAITAMKERIDELAANTDFSFFGDPARTKGWTVITEG